MRFFRLSTALAVAGLAGLAPAQQAFATVPHIRGPMPMENARHFTEHARATTKWPNSCKKMISEKPATM